jgi:hypothetical protein
MLEFDLETSCSDTMLNLRKAIPSWDCIHIYIEVYNKMDYMASMLWLMEVQPHNNHAKISGGRSFITTELRAHGSFLI